MTADDLLTAALDVAYFTIFGFTFRDYVLRREPVRLAVVAVFGSVALLLGGATIGALWPDAAGLTGTVALLALLAQPVLTLWLLRHFRPVPARVLVGSVGLFLFFVVFVVLVVVGGTDGPLAAVGVPVLLLAIAYFVILELACAVLFALEARRRAGASRARLAIAAAATGLFGAAVLVLGAGGIIAGSNDGSSATISVITRLLAFLAALGYLAAFVPPRPLRLRSQQGTAYAFVRDINQLPTGASVNQVWTLLAETARASAGASAAVVAIDSPFGGAELRAVVGDWPVDGGRPLRLDEVGATPELGAAKMLTVPIRSDLARVGTLALIVRGSPLFVDDDLELLELLARSGLRAVEREQLIVELQAASQAKSDFLASMSHELRTPLSAIIGFSDLMRSEHREGTSLIVPAEWVEHINKSGNHLLGLINDVLDLSKVEAGRIELQLEVLDLAGAIAESIAGLRPLADRKQLLLEAEVVPTALKVDRGRFRQMLYNLLSNAIKYTPEGGDIRVTVQSSPSDVRVSVIDSGVGISPEDQAHVFEEFRQVGDPAARQAGTGLGLALTRRLVEAHGGRIELTSAIGAGSTFSLVFPLGAAPSPAAPPPPSEAGRQPVGPRTTGSGGVLVIEDDPSAMRLLRTYLKTAGYEVRAAGDGLNAIADARERAPSAIILDLLLPGLDGWEVLRQLKDDPDLRDIPVIIVTVVDEREVGLALGAVDYFVKPVDRVALLARLDRYTFTTKVRERPITVLAVDDEAAALQLIEAALRPDGFTVVAVDRGQAALDIARAGGIDLIICDLLMPDLDGFEVVATLKADDRTRDIPILILTAHDLTAADKDRLSGHILGVVSKGADAESGLRAWLTRVAPLDRSESTAPEPDRA